MIDSSRLSVDHGRYTEVDKYGKAIDLGIGSKFDTVFTVTVIV